jgi:hypothetical protein
VSCLSVNSKLKIDTFNIMGQHRFIAAKISGATSIVIVAGVIAVKLVKLRHTLTFPPPL